MYNEDHPMWIGREEEEKRIKEELADQAMERSVARAEEIDEILENF